jgi:hypothetical protein
VASPRRLSDLVVVAAAAAVLWPALDETGRAQEPSLQTVLTRAADYTGRLHTQLAGIVAEEFYVQEVRERVEPSSPRDALPRRALRSDLLLVKPSGERRYVEYRDVFEVDGAPVRDRQDRLTALFLVPSQTNQRHLKAIIDESARHNIGDIPRNINTPMLTLSFLLPDVQPRFRFRRGRAAQPSLSDQQLRTDAAPPVFRTAAELWAIEFRETRRPTIIRTNLGRSFPASGRFWIDPANGTVLISELEMTNDDVSGTINVSYQSEPELGFLVPAEMRERYTARRALVEGRATYGRFRRFLVKTDEVIRRPPGD